MVQKENNIVLKYLAHLNMEFGKIHSLYGNRLRTAQQHICTVGDKRKRRFDISNDNIGLVVILCFRPEYTLEPLVDHEMVGRCRLEITTDHKSETIRRFHNV